jgi:hypothetical protein
MKKNKIINLKLIKRGIKMSIIIDIDNNIVNPAQIIRAIAMFKGIKRIEVQNIKKNQLLIEKMETGESVSDNEYLASIPGFMEALNEESKDAF